MALTIGVDVGGTKVAGGVVDEEGTVLARTGGRRRQRTRPAPGTPSSRSPPSWPRVPGDHAIGIGAAAWIDAAGSTVLFAPNLAWRDEPVRDYVAKAVGLPTVLENDANVAAWANSDTGPPGTPTTRW